MMAQSGPPGPSNVNASFTNSTINGPSIQAQTVYVGRSKNDEEPSLGVVDDNRNKLVIRQEKTKPCSVQASISVPKPREGDEVHRDEETESVEKTKRYILALKPNVPKSIELKAPDSGDEDMAISGQLTLEADAAVTMELKNKYLRLCLTRRVRG